MKHPFRILYDLLVQVITSIFPVDFVILECDIYVEIPIILGSPFLATGKELMDIESWKLKFWVNDDEVTFNTFNAMKQPTDIHGCPLKML